MLVKSGYSRACRNDEGETKSDATRVFTGSVSSRSLMRHGLSTILDVRKSGSCTTIVGWSAVLEVVGISSSCFLNSPNDEGSAKVFLWEDVPCVDVVAVVL